MCNCSSPVYYGERCEQKINVCWNKTCNMNGKCFDNNSNLSFLNELNKNLFTKFNLFKMLSYSDLPMLHILFRS
jgi:hypothetical protein